jgi:ribonuclease P protein component
LIREGHSRKNDSFRMTVLDGPIFRLGIIASNKLGNAVVRNRIKRLVRAEVRAGDLEGEVVVFVAPRAVKLLENHDAERFRSELGALIAATKRG